MGVVGALRNLDIRGLYVRKKGDRYGSLNRDGVHMNGLRGKLTFEDSLLEGMGDDGLNIHNQNSEIVNVVNSTAVDISSFKNNATWTGPSTSFLPHTPPLFPFQLS